MMLKPTSHLVSLAYVASVSLGGAFMTKKTASAVIWIWNKSVNGDKKISEKTQDHLLKACEVIGGLFFAVLTIKEVFSENAKQLKILKDFRNLEKELNDLYKAVYNKGKEDIHNFTLKLN